jgi:hypothetical protein
MVNPKRNTSKRVASKSAVKQMHHQMKGHELKVPPQPPEFTSRPWFSLTVRVDNVPATFSLANLMQQFRNQLGFGPDFQVYVRLKNIRIWGPLVPFSATTTLQPLNVSFYDFIAENSFTSTTITLENRILEQYTRYPDQLHRASIGYEYSLAHQSVALFQSTTNNLNLCASSGTGAGSVAYVQLLWRPGTLAPAANPTSDPVNIVPTKSWF